MRSRLHTRPVDGPQEMEIEMNARLARRANELGVQVIVEEWAGMSA